MKEIRTSHIIKVFKNMLSINLKDGLRNNVRNWQQVSDIDREKKIELIHDMGKLNEVTQHVKENERRLISKLNVMCLSLYEMVLAIRLLCHAFY